MLENAISEIKMLLDEFSIWVEMTEKSANLKIDQ